jgi:drug/metabolite transporter (DMT)-like permease
MGHTMFNLSLKRVSPAIVALSCIFRGTSKRDLAFLWLDQKPPAGTIPGIIGLLIGCGIFVVRSKND